RTPGKIRFVERAMPPPVTVEVNAASATEVVTKAATAAPRAVPRRTQRFRPWSGPRAAITRLRELRLRPPPDVDHADQRQQERSEQNGEQVDERRAEPEHRPADLRHDGSDLPGGRPVQLCLPGVR